MAFVVEREGEERDKETKINGPTDSSVRSYLCGTEVITNSRALTFALLALPTETFLVFPRFLHIPMELSSTS